MNRFSIHAGGQPNSPEIPGFEDQELCSRIWNTMHTTYERQTWGQLGLGVIERHPHQMGYDLHLLVTLEGTSDPIDAWMWSFD